MIHHRTTLLAVVLRGQTFSESMFLYISPRVHLTAYWFPFKEPLPHVNELTSDLFDLILRLAVNDDNIEQGDMSIPLRLVTPSVVQSVSTVLQAVSDHLDWLLPISISSRYRFILQNIIQTFKCNESSSLLHLFHH
jgi:hypothetical protein